MSVCIGCVCIGGKYSISLSRVGGLENNGKQILHKLKIKWIMNIIRFRKGS